MRFKFEKHKTPLHHYLSEAFIRRSEAKANAFTVSILPFCLWPSGEAAGPRDSVKVPFASVRSVDEHSGLGWAIQGPGA